MSQKILFVDKNDPRRATRVAILTSAGYEVEVRNDVEASELLDHEAHFDLILIALNRSDLRAAAAYSEMLRKKRPTLPILLLTDTNVFVPRGTLSPHSEGGYPKEMLEQIADMLAGSKHIREIDESSVDLPLSPAP